MYIEHVVWRDVGMKASHMCYPLAGASALAFRAHGLHLVIHHRFLGHAVSGSADCPTLHTHAPRCSLAHGGKIESPRDRVVRVGIVTGNGAVHAVQLGLVHACGV